MNENGSQDLLLEDEMEAFRSLLASAGGGSFLSEKTRARIEQQIGCIVNISEYERSRCERLQLDFIRQLLELQKVEYSSKTIDRVRDAMDRSHAGMDEMKSLLLNQLRMSAMTEERPQPLLFVGPPGCGKTTLALSFAKALGAGWDKIQLSGMTGAFMLSGNDTSYKDSKPGRIISALVNSGSLNPVIILDEVDKVGRSDQNGAILNALMEVLDEKQCESYIDHFLNIPFNLSEVRFILTANTLEGIPAPLLDRCTVCYADSYSFAEKKTICNKLIKEMNSRFKSSSLVFRDEQIDALVLKCGSAPGVRILESLVRKAFMMMCEELMKGEDENIIVRRRVIDDICRVQDIEMGYDFSPHAGVVNSLVTADGSGALFPIEAVIVNEVIPDVTVTGMVERMLKESTEVAASVARRYIKEHFLTDISSIEIHYPYPVMKDGDSAGCAAAAAVISAFTGKAMLSDFAITGAISLTGQVLSVGCCIEKVMAAKRLGIHNVIIPASERSQFSAIPASAFSGVHLHFVAKFEEVCTLLFPSVITNVNVEKECRKETKERSILC